MYPFFIAGALLASEPALGRSRTQPHLPVMVTSQVHYKWTRAGGRLRALVESLIAAKLNWPLPLVEQHVIR